VTRWILALLSHLPAPLLCTASALLGDLWFFLVRVRRDVALDNLTASAVDPGEAGRRDLVRRCCRGLALNVLELPRLVSLDDERFFGLVQVEGAHHLREAAAAGRGVVVASAHLGNWELLSSVSRRLGFDTAMMTRPLSSRSSHGWVNRQRTRSGTQVLVEGPEQLSAMLGALRRGQVLGITVDQRPRGRALRSPFLGRSALHSRTAACIALRARAPLVVVTIHRVRGLRHRVQIAPAVWPARDARPIPAQVDELTRQVITSVETAIARHPDQWLWHHRRWAGSEAA